MPPKVYPDAEAQRLAAEVPRLRWAGRYTPCPGCLRLGQDGCIPRGSRVVRRWTDLAIAKLSLDWNFPTEGPGGFQEALLDTYGVAADIDRIDYLRRLWDEGDIASH